MCGSGTFLTEGALDRRAMPRRRSIASISASWAGAATMRRSGSACARRRVRAAPRARARRCILGRTSTPMRCACRLPMASRPGSPTGCTWRSARSARSRRPRATRGSIVANPPYGERIGAESGLPALYAELGSVLRDGSRAGRPRFSRAIRRWREIWAFTPSAPTGSSTAPSSAAAALRLERGQRATAGRSGARGLVEPARRADVRQSAAQEPGAPGPLDEREGIDCFRVYDADMPEYAFAIDLYGRAARHVYVQEYAAAQDRRSGERPGAPPRGVGRAAGDSGRADFARPLPRAQAAEGQRAVREARRSGANVTPCRKAA